MIPPDVVVLDLASSGGRGLRIVDDVHAAVPSAAVVLLAPFEGLRTSAVSAGAYDLVGTDDLRPLGRTLRRLAAELDARDSITLPAGPHLLPARRGLQRKAGRKSSGS